MATVHSFSNSSGGLTDNQLAQLRVPPHSVEAEQAVLGGLLLDNQAWDKIADLVNELDLYRQDHRQILRSITRLIGENKPADVVTVAEALQSHGELESIGGLPYLASLASNTPSAANIRRYAEIVRERAVMRKLVETATGIADSAYSPNGKSASSCWMRPRPKCLKLPKPATAAGQDSARSNRCCVRSWNASMSYTAVTIRTT